MKTSEWSKSSWRLFPVYQQPQWPDKQMLADELAKVARLPALVFAEEPRALKRQLAEAVEGRTFVLHCGDCTEDFSSCHGPRIHDRLKVILQMFIILAFAGEKQTHCFPDCWRK
jgi:3-deoxy-7-phosphoheptulonate synthase